ncbi:hypothetical protein C0J52_27156 [Blattella germanica]|nr:hypothetical protein C0J52_27156 [Blattella germanica]
MSGTSVAVDRSTCVGGRDMGQVMSNNRHAFHHAIFHLFEHPVNHVAQFRDQSLQRIIKDASLSGNGLVDIVPDVLRNGVVDWWGGWLVGGLGEFGPICGVLCGWRGFDNWNMAGDPEALASYIEHPMSETETIFDPEKSRSIFLDDIYYPRTLMKKNFPKNNILNDQSSYNLFSPYALLNSNFQKKMFPPTSQYQTNRFSNMPPNHLNFDEVMSHPTTFQHLGTPYAYSPFFPFTGFHSNIQQNGIDAGQHHAIFHLFEHPVNHVAQFRDQSLQRIIRDASLSGNGLVDIVPDVLRNGVVDWWGRWLVGGLGEFGPICGVLGGWRGFDIWNMAGDPEAHATYIEHPMSETETIFEPEKARIVFLDDIFYPKTLMKKNFPRNTILNDQSSYNLVSPYALLKSNFQKKMFPPTSQYQTNRFSNMPLNHLNFDEVMSHPTTFQHLGTPYAYSTFFPFTGFHSNTQQNGIAAGQHVLPSGTYEDRVPLINLNAYSSLHHHKIPSSKALSNIIKEKLFSELNTNSNPSIDKNKIPLSKVSSPKSIFEKLFSQPNLNTRTDIGNNRIPIPKDFSNDLYKYLLSQTKYNVYPLISYYKIENSKFDPIDNLDKTLDKIISFIFSNKFGEFCDKIRPIVDGIIDLVNWQREL